MRSRIPLNTLAQALRGPAVCPRAQAIRAGQTRYAEAAAAIMAGGGLDALHSLDALDDAFMAWEKTWAGRFGTVPETFKP